MTCVISKLPFKNQRQGKDGQGACDLAHEMRGVIYNCFLAYNEFQNDHLIKCLSEVQFPNRLSDARRIRESSTR